MRYSQFKKQVTALSHHYTVFINVNAVTIRKQVSIRYKGKFIAWIGCDQERDFMVVTGFEKLPFSRKLYMYIAELAVTPLKERENEYYIRAIDTDLGYLNVSDDKAVLASSNNVAGWKAKFKMTEIEELKKREDIRIDWDKALEVVE